MLKFRIYYPILALFLATGASAQPVSKKALFLGNSYTYVNDLPSLIASLASSSGDSLIYASNAPGGYTLGWQPIAHATNPLSLAMINSNEWDFMILQEQSQTPAISRLRDSCMYPASIILHDSVKSAHPCCRVLFFLTWGRRFGGMQCFTPNYCSPVFTGFEQMQDSLTRAYKGVADSLADWIAPVGEAWRFVISNSGMALHDADNSHPNLNGSYLAACVFYDVIFGKTSSGNSFTAGLSADTALLLQHAADSITFGYSSQWNLNNDVPFTDFALSVSADTLFTKNLCSGASTWLWDFGDGQTSGLYEPVHVYSSPGTYYVKLRACNDCFCDSTMKETTFATTGITPLLKPDPDIRVQGPDQEGFMHIMNYMENGTLTLYHMNGSLRAIVPVTGGVAHTGRPYHGLMIWILTNKRNEVIKRGIFIL